MKQGFGRGHVKEYFVLQRDGDVIGGVVAGPFQTQEQCFDALEALRPLYFAGLTVAGGHLVGWTRPVGWWNE